MPLGRILQRRRGSDDPMQPKQKARRAWRTWAIEIAIGLAIFLGIRTWQGRELASGAAPALTAQGLDGRALSLETLRGRPALVHFWATWCGVCQAEEGTIEKLAKDKPMITVAASSGDAAKVAAYLKERGLELPVVVDESGEIARAWGVRAFPTTFVVGGDGDIAFREVGFTTGPGLRARLWLAGL